MLEAAPFASLSVRHFAAAAPAALAELRLADLELRDPVTEEPGLR